MGFSILLIKAFEIFEINEPASAGFFFKNHSSTNRHEWSPAMAEVMARLAEANHPTQIPCWKGRWGLQRRPFV
jgi:hypothetical protein